MNLCHEQHVIDNDRTVFENGHYKDICQLQSNTLYICMKKGKHNCFCPSTATLVFVIFNVLFHWMIICG